MLTSLMLSAALLAQSPEVLDSEGLRQAIDATRTTPAASPSLAGRRFRVTIPFVDGRRRDMRTFQSPARWTYDYRRGELELSIGLGEITEQNYRQFKAQGLGDLPPLQSAVFDGDERKTPTMFREQGDRGAVRHDLGVRSIVHSYGMAAPYTRGGPSALPAGFEPLMLYRIRMDHRQFSALVRDLDLVLEGEISAISGTPAFCGDYHGQLAAQELTGALRMEIKVYQCFTTVRIARVAVVRGGRRVLAAWGEAPP